MDKQERFNDPAKPRLEFYGGPYMSAVPLAFFILTCGALIFADALSERGILLGSMAGLSLGTSLTETSDDSTLREKLVAHTQRFQNQLADLSDESVNKLSAFFNDAMLTLRQT